jgi:tetratricopeptide (TPR) repeat protein
MEAKVRGIRVEDLRPDRPRISALRVASEVEHVFGRNALDEFLRETLDDANLLPGVLHRQLLGLPWSDVFTTNYDRLLERACSSVVDRKYDVVFGPEDIPGTLKPRIVKLHGSFSSHRPFIITEEDYRTYPHRFAPFVNMVQQSIMENAFCLLGFSGDDPNFIEWTGWVQDNMGASTPPIYLVGALDLSEWQRDALSKRGVTAVDLGPLLPKASWPERSIRHRGALEWFLQSLQNGAPADPNDWPSEFVPPAPMAKAGVPAPMPPDVTLSPRGREAVLGGLTPEYMERLRSQWQSDRRRYPGWLTCPPDNRERLWRETQDVLGLTLQALSEQPPPQCLLFLSELAWRLSRLETPPYEPIQALVSNVLGKVNPFPAQLNIEGALTPKADAALPWERLAVSWRELAEFALVWARRDDDAAAFAKYSGWLANIAQTFPYLAAFLAWQRSLQHLCRFSISALRRELDGWVPTPELPLWEVRRGALLAELGELREAQAVLERALEAIRARLGSAGQDRELLSYEGWAMAVLRAASMQLSAGPVDLRTYTKRWARLERYRASPWDDLESLRETLRDIPPKRASFEVRKEFDPGAYSTSSHFGSGDPKLRAFQALGIVERGGAPFRVGTDNTFGGLAQLAAVQLVDAAPLWALSAIVRSDAIDKADRVLSRPRVMAYPAEEASRVIAYALGGLEEALPKLDADDSQWDRPPLARRLVDNISELLSRLTLRMSKTERTRAFRLACSGLLSKGVRRNLSLWKPMGHLLTRALAVMDDGEFASALPTVLGLPLPGEGTFAPLGAVEQAWPEPFAALDARTGLAFGPCPRVDELIDLVRHGDEVVRARACRRLAWLDEAGLLGAYGEPFADALWAKTDPATKLPSGTPFLRSAFLTLPMPQSVDAKSLVRAYALTGQCPAMSAPATLPNGAVARSVGFPNSAREHFRELIGMSNAIARDASDRIAWTPGEARALLEKAQAWWMSEQPHFRKFKAPRMGAMGSAAQVISSFVEMLALAIAPYLDPPAASEGLRLVDSLEADGVPTLAARVAFQGGDSAAAPALVEKIRAALSVDDASARAAVEDALQAVAVWCLGKHRLPADLLDDVLVRILAGRQQGNNLALNLVTAVVRRKFDLVSKVGRRLLESVLRILLADTSVESAEDDAVRSGLSLEERPEFRSLAAELAGVVFAAEQEAGVPLSGALVQWKAIGENDPLPEVRTAWKNAVMQK